MTDYLKEKFNGNAWLVRLIAEVAFGALVTVSGLYITSSLSSLTKAIDTMNKRHEALEDRFNARTDRFAAIEARQAAAEVRDANFLETMNSIRMNIEQIRRDLSRHTDETRSLRR